MHWRWSARTPWNTGGTRSHYRWRSAFSGFWASAGGAIITRRSLRLLEELAPHWGDDWWFLGYLGWAYIETGCEGDPAGRALARRKSV
jgi:hypothetical protein